MRSLSCAQSLSTDTRARVSWWVCSSRLSSRWLRAVKMLVSDIAARPPSAQTLTIQTSWFLSEA